MPKYNRHGAIIDIIKNNVIETQDELVAQLKELGFNSTQATVSRDIRELRLIKVLTADGRYKYATTAGELKNNIESRLTVIFAESVISVENAANLVVVKTLSGMAQAACAAIDGIGYSEVVGTIGGDDTLLIVLRSSNNALKLSTKLKTLMK